MDADAMLGCIVIFLIFAATIVVTLVILYGCRILLGI